VYSYLAYYFSSYDLHISLDLRFSKPLVEIFSYMNQIIILRHYLFIKYTVFVQNRFFRKQFIIANKFNLKRQTTLFNQ